MAQDGCLLRVPWPIAEGTGTHHPTVFHRHAVLPCVRRTCQGVFIGSSCVVKSCTQEDISVGAPAL